MGDGELERWADAGVWCSCANRVIRPAAPAPRPSAPYQLIAGTAWSSEVSRACARASSVVYQ